MKENKIKGKYTHIDREALVPCLSLLQKERMYDILKAIYKFEKLQDERQRSLTEEKLQGKTVGRKNSVDSKYGRGKKASRKTFSREANKNTNTISGGKEPRRRYTD